MQPSDPIEAIKFRMDQQGLTPRDLEPFIGPSGRVSEVLNRKRKLSLAMIKRLHDGLRIPYECLLASV
jgi:HTH-type transcriptional regulator/antitoxin HigA